MTKSRHINRPRQDWLAADVRTLRRLYPDTVTKAIAERLGRPLANVYAKAQRLGLQKSAAFLGSAEGGRLRPGDTRGGATRFQKGQRSWNKGTSYMPGGRCADGWFKKGIRRGVAVKLYKPVGTERVSKDGYLERKINDGLPLQKRWRAVHLVMWEEANGPLPKGHAIVFRNGDKRDIRLDNLECITRKALMLRNTLHRYPQPIPQLIQLRGAVNRQINKRNRNEERHRGSEEPPVRRTRRAGRQGQPDGDRPRPGDQ